MDAGRVQRAVWLLSNVPIEANPSLNAFEVVVKGLGMDGFEPFNCMQKLRATSGKPIAQRGFHHCLEKNELDILANKITINSYIH